MLKKGSKSLRGKYAIGNIYRMAKGTTSFPNFTQTVNWTLKYYSNAMYQQ